MSVDPALRERIAEGYHRYQYGDNGTHDTLVEAALVADAVLDALGLEQVPILWCAIHQEVLYPRDYIESDCTPEPLYRLGGNR